MNRIIRGFLAATTALLLVGVTPLAWAGSVTDLPIDPSVSQFSLPPSDPSITATWSMADPIEPDRLFRDGIPSSYTSQKPFPGIFPEADRFATFSGSTLTNMFTTPAALFVTLTPNPSTSVGTFVSAYLGSFDPNNLASNYLGDAGVSGISSFSVLVPVGGAVTLVANTVGGINAVLGESYTITYTLVAVPEPSSAVLMGLGTTILGAFAYRRRRAGAGLPMA